MKQKWNSIYGSGLDFKDYHTIFYIQVEDKFAIDNIVIYSDNGIMDYSRDVIDHLGGNSDKLTPEMDVYIGK